MKMFHRFDIFLRGLGRLGVWVIEFVASSKESDRVSMLNRRNIEDNPLGSLISITPATAVLDLPNELCLESSITNTLHHRKMLEVVMRLK